MKVIFMASPEIAVETLHALTKCSEVKAIITQADKPHKRSKKPVPTPIAEAGEKLNINVYKFEKITKDDIHDLKMLNCDLFITFAYGIILKEDFFSITKFGGINIHPSDLPDLRGPSPIQSALLSNYSETALSIQQVSLKVDSGDILAKYRVEIQNDDDAASLNERISTLSAEVISDIINNYQTLYENRTKQNHEKATYCRLIKKEDALINWDDSAINIVNKIRAFTQWPVAYSYFNGKKIMIYKAVISDYDNKNTNPGDVICANKSDGLIIKSNNKSVKILELQLEGKKRIKALDFINGQRNITKLENTK